MSNVESTAQQSITVSVTSVSLGAFATSNLLFARKTAEWANANSFLAEQASIANAAIRA